MKAASTQIKSMESFKQESLQIDKGRGKKNQEILSVLADARLLAPEFHTELVNELMSQCHEWDILFAEMVYRNWLTSYQVNQINAGKADSLFLNHYVILEPLKIGNLTEIFLARNTKMQQLVAIKLIQRSPEENPRTIQRFIREIESLGKINHPNIISSLDATIANDLIYYVMEYVPGSDLKKRVEEVGPLTIPETISYIIQIADGLQHIHEQGLVHRDIKPSNIMLLPDKQWVKLLDLGLARMELSEQDQPQITKIGNLLGTPDYIAPEQIQDPSKADIRSDLYSLGCTMYYLLVGAPPFADYETVDKLYAHLLETPKPIDQLRRDLPKGLAEIVHKLIAKQEIDRYQTPRGLIRALLPYLDLNHQNGNDPDKPLKQKATTASEKTDHVVQTLFDTPLPRQLTEVIGNTQIVTISKLDIVLPSTNLKEGSTTEDDVEQLQGEIPIENAPIGLGRLSAGSLKEKLQKNRLLATIIPKTMVPLWVHALLVLALVIMGIIFFRPLLVTPEIEKSSKSAMKYKELQNLERNEESPQLEGYPTDHQE